MERETTAFPVYIHEARRPIPAPESMVKDGQVLFGAFEGLIKNLNITDAEKPVSALVPRFAYSARLREWEAYEVCFDEGFVCGAIYDAGPMVFNIMMFYDRETQKVMAKQSFGHPRKCVGNTLVNSSNSLVIRDFRARIDNRFQEGRAFIRADYSPRTAGRTALGALLELESCSKPGITVMPMGENRPVYTHKELFRAKGKIWVGDRSFTMNENSLAIIDDHKGFYPLKMHYDWITVMGMKNGVPLGVNLCKNQALDPRRFSENLFWLGEEQFLLPPVSFRRQPNGDWHISDGEGVVDITFETHDRFTLRKKIFIHSMDYTAPYGTVKGWVRDYSGEKVILDGMLCMGEDISVKNL